MGRDERLKLLFEDDESLLQTDTHLNRTPHANYPTLETAQESPAADVQSEVKAVSDKQIAEDVSSPSEQVPGRHKVREELPDCPVDDKIPEEKHDSLASSDGQVSSKGEGETDAHELQNNPKAGDDSSKEATEAPHDPLKQQFCPLLAVSRFPYRYIQGELSQQVASRFFDQGKFWNRCWDLYYIHVPPHLGSRPLLLVPAAQIKKLLQEINLTLECSLSLPTENHLGFVLPFLDDGTPQPIFIGQFTSRDMKDKLEGKIPLPSGNYNDYDAMDPLFVEFEKKIEAGITATKNKKKASKVKREQVRIQTQREWARCLKRAQCYFGLRPRCPRNGICPEVGGEASWEEQGKQQENDLISSIATPPLDLNEPAPFSFWNEPIFISIDVESNERCHSQVTEIGISTLDTLDLVGIPPGEKGKNWLSTIRSRHLRTREYAHVVNRDFIHGCPENFEFGKSEWVSVKDLVVTVDRCFQPPYSSQVLVSSNVDPDGAEATGKIADEIEADNVQLKNGIPLHKLRPRNIVFVGHNPAADIAYLRTLGTTVFDRAGDDSAPLLLDALDTAKLFRTLWGDASPRSLGNILGEFGITGWYLHNAGNDARYTMEAIVQIVLGSRGLQEPPKEQNGNGEGQLMADGGWVDDIDGGEPKGIKKI